MTTVDLSRIPEVYRERVQRLVTAAEAEAAEKTWPEDVEHACREARAAALAPYLKIADEADIAAWEGRDRLAGPIKESVWSRRVAELDAIAQPEPPASYWSTGIAVERQATPDAEQAVRAAQRAHLDAATEELSRRAQVAAREAAQAVLTGTARTEARLDIHDGDGLRVALDGLVRYLADKPRETVATINALLRTLPHSSYLTVGLGTSTPEAHALLVSLGGRDRVVDYYGSALHHCCIEIDGIEWRASYTPAPSRPTIAGAAVLDMAASAGGDR